jgi:hypothetical protein
LRSIEIAYSDPFQRRRVTIRAAADAFRSQFGF